MRDLLELYQTSEAFSHLAELQELLLPILEELAEQLGYERAFVALVDAERPVLQGAVGLRVPEEMLETLEARLPDSPSPMVQAFLTGRPVRVDDALRDDRVPEDMRDYYSAFGMRSFATIPLLNASGVLVVSKAQPISETDVDELLPYVGRLSAAVAERSAGTRQRPSDEHQAVEKEWLWWMLNAVHDPILLSDERNELILRNAPAERLLAARPGASVGKRRAIELNNFLLSAALSSFALGQSASMARELTLVDPIEGDELLFEVISRPATNLRTGERGLVHVLKDVTDLRRATEEVTRSLAELEQAGEQARRERDRLNLILENVADPIVVTDPAGQTILMNPQAERLLQQPDDVPVAGRRTIYLANDAKLTSFLSQLRLEASTVLRGEIELLDPQTDESLPMSVTATEIHDQLGEVTAVVSVLHDLTEVRELERRTIEQQLFESEKQAALGRLAAAVAHEVNNPLEAIKNALYLVLSRTAEGDENRRFLEIASTETNRVSDIIRQLLAFYRPVATREPVDVNHVVDEVAELLDRQLRQARVAVRASLDTGLPPVRASGDQLKQVFINLVLNARDAMPDGGTLYVTSRLSRETDAEFLAGRYVLVQFRDTGGGIAAEHLPHIFEPFYTTKVPTKGTGLGLWVSQDIVQNHGGQLKVHSRVGRGTTFTVALPPLGSESA